MRQKPLNEERQSQRVQRMLGLALFLIALFAGSGLAAAQADSLYILHRDTTASGGPPLAGSEVHLRWTLGEPFAGTVTGGNVVATGGFWAGLFSAREPADTTIFVPHVVRD